MEVHEQVTSQIPNEKPELGFQTSPPKSDLPLTPSDFNDHEPEAEDLGLCEKLRSLDLKEPEEDQKDSSGEENDKSEESDEDNENENENENEKEKEKENDNESDSESDNENESEKAIGDDYENKIERRKYQYPVRPEAEDCSYYMKTGTCKFGSNCKFNHPVRRKNQAAREKVKEREESMERPGLAECKYYLRTGGCKFGKACRYNHTKAKISAVPILELNFLGLPIRLGEKECPYYMRNGSCKYGANCRFNHPDPTAVGGCDPPSGYGNGGSVPSQVASPSSIAASWSSPRAMNETAPFVPLMFSPTQGVPSQSPEWNGYQSPLYPPERSMHPPPAYIMNNPGTETNVYTHHQPQMLVDEFPERPGQPECTFFLKTGDCKFKSNCKYHHPKNRISKPPPCALSDKGLPLRPDQNICTHYSRYGICKFGPACKFDHPIHPASPTMSGLEQPSSFGNAETTGATKLAGSGNESNTSIQQTA